MPADPTYHYTIEDIQRYLNGSMSAKEMHDLEKAALNDPFIADAIDGYRKADPAITAQHLNEIKARLRIENKESGKVVAIKTVHKNWWRGVAAAAILGGLAIASWLLLQPTEKSNEIASIKQKMVDTSASSAASMPPGTPASEIKSLDSEQYQKNNNSVVKTLPANTVVNAELPAPQSPELAKTNINSGRADAISVDQPSWLRRVESPAAQEAKINRQINEPIPSFQTPVVAPVWGSDVAQMYSGVITNEIGQPIPSATVVAAKVSTLSNPDGSFVLPAMDSAAIATISAVGYEPQKTTLLAGKIAGISLKGNQEQLNEVVVVGYGNQKKMVRTGAISEVKPGNMASANMPYPEKGWDDFYRSFYSKMGIDPQHARQTLRLKFDLQNGRPQKFTILQAPDSITANKAIDIIKRGPAWKNTMTNNIAEVSFKVK